MVQKQTQLHQTKIRDLILSVLISLLFFTSLVHSQNFLSTVWAPKFYASFFIIITISIVYYLRFIVDKSPVKIIVHQASLIFLIYFIYILVQLWVTDNLSLQNHRFIILFISIILYFVISNIVVADRTNNKMPMQIMITGYLCIALVQSCYALAQWAGLIPNLMQLYSFGGAFGNPNILATYLISILPFALAVYLFYYPSNYSYKYLKTLSISVLIAGTLVVIICKSRAACLGLLGGFYLVVHYKFKLINVYQRFLKPVYAKVLVLILALGFLILAGKLLYQYKPDSADGRLFIWKNTSRIIAGHPVFGIGYGKFPLVYNNYQAGYFASVHDDKNAWLASCVDSAFNEFLQVLAETGIIGFAIFVFFLQSLLFVKKTDKTNDTDFLYVAALSSFVALLINSLVSYTINTDAVYFNFIFLAAILSAAKDSKALYQFSVPASMAPKLAFIIIIALGLFAINKYNAYKEEKNLSNIVVLLKNGLFVKAREECQKAYPYLIENKEFILLYGKTLQFNKEYANAIDFLESSKKYCYSEKLYLLLGDAYLAAGNFKKFEENYVYVKNMIPALLEPKALLVKLYEASGQTAKAIELAKNVIAMKEKVPSQKTKEIKAYMQNLMDQLNAKK